MLRVAVLACLATAVVSLSYKECMPNSAVYINHVSISPYPPSLSNGFSITYDAGSHEVIDDDVDVKLTLKAKIGFLWVTIPCIKDVGSCVYKDACSLMEEIPSEVCDELKDLGLPCNCPVPVTSVKGTYDVPAIDGIPDSIKGLLNRNVHAKVKVIQNRRVIGCLEGEATING